MKINHMAEKETTERVKLNDRVWVASTGKAQGGHPKGTSFEVHPHQADHLVESGKATLGKGKGKSEKE